MVHARWWAFFHTFSNYAVYHAGRKTFSVVKPALESEGFLQSAGMTTHEAFGVMDSLFLTTYSIGLWLSGPFADRHDLRRVIAGGLLISAALTAAFGLGGAAENFAACQHNVKTNS